MDHQIIGSTLPVLELTLAHGETIISEAGELSWMNGNVEMKTHTQAGGGGGMFGALKRAAGGNTLFMTEYTAAHGEGLLAFATKVPGAILPLQVGPGQEYMIHKHGFLCGTDGVNITVGFQQSLGAGVFGGDGFRLTRLTGPCQAWIELDGEVVTYDLAPGQVLRVHPGHVGMFESSVNFGITRIKGIKNMIFGGDGIFLAELTGPGRVWLQSLPISNLAHALSPYLTADDTKAGIAGGILGAALKS